VSTFFLNRQQKLGEHFKGFSKKAGSLVIDQEIDPLILDIDGIIAEKSVLNLETKVVLALDYRKFPVAWWSSAGKAESVWMGT